MLHPFPKLPIRVQGRLFVVVFATSHRQVEREHVTWVEPGRHILQAGETSDEKSCTDRKSTRLNSSHRYTSYAVFCLKKKKKKNTRSGKNMKILREKLKHIDVSK